MSPFGEKTVFNIIFSNHEFKQFTICRLIKQWINDSKYVQCKKKYSLVAVLLHPLVTMECDAELFLEESSVWHGREVDIVDHCFLSMFKSHRHQYHFLHKKDPTILTIINRSMC